MTGLSDYELRVLRQMATGGDGDLICGPAMWVALATLTARGLVRKTVKQDSADFTIEYGIADAGRALVRERDAELTEAKNER